MYSVGFDAKSLSLHLHGDQLVGAFLIRFHVCKSTRGSERACVAEPETSVRFLGMVEGTKTDSGERSYELHSGPDSN